MKLLQLKDILPYLSWTDNVVIEQGDVYKGTTGKHTDEWEEIFRGSAMNVPWYMTEYYLKNTRDFEAMNAYIDQDSEDIFISISVVENKKYAGSED